MQLYHIGRSSTNEIVLEDATVSKVHAQLVVADDGSITIADLNSRNGTFVNGERIKTPYRLQAGDMTVLGAMLFIWEDYVPIPARAAASSSATAPRDASAEPSPARNNRFLLLSAMVLILLICSYLVYSVITQPDLPEVAETDTTPAPAATADNAGMSAPSPTEPTSSPEAPTTSPVSNEIEYDFSCLGDETDPGITDLITLAGDLEGEMVDALAVEVSVPEEEDYGQEAYEQMQDEYSFIRSGEALAQIQSIGQQLVRAIHNPAGFHYQFYLIQSDEINAFTIGGQVFVTTAMIDFLNTTDELACVLGHEIGHNELGHIKRALQKNKTANEVLGEDVGNFSTMVYNTMTTSFGQRQEAHCDFFGIDLAVSCGFNGCASVEVWTRMSEGEGEWNMPENFFNSHPFSSKRAMCSNEHMRFNHHQNCSH